MGLFDLSRKSLAVILSAQLVLATQAVTLAEAQMLGSDEVINRYAAMADRALLLGELQRADVRDQIIDLGIDPAEAEARLAALSDAEVATILTQMDNHSAGADIAGTLFSVFIILLVTDFLCFTRVFSFTRCVR